MQPLDVEQQVIDAAEALARTLGRNPNHTVSAAVMDIDGQIFRAVNVSHFNGGPCAELVALGVAAAAGSEQLLTIAAAGDRGRGLIPPCGRCRQVLLDQHPGILVAVPTGEGPAMRPVHKLLADSYFYPDGPTGRILRFNRRYYDSVVSGSKTSTIRWDEPVQIGPVTLVFEGHPAFAHLEGEVLSIEPTTMAELDPDYANSLRELYPTMPDDAELSRVEFGVNNA